MTLNQDRQMSAEIS